MGQGGYLPTSSHSYFSTVSGRLLTACEGRENYRSGRKIVEILGKNNSDYTDDDINHMRRVVSYVHRHQAQQPKGDAENSNWRYSLMNWGHDPLR